jgi:hypothetical protein
MLPALKTTMPFTCLPMADSLIVQVVSFRSSVNNNKKTIEKKKRIVQLCDALRKATSRNATLNTIRCFGELDFANHINSTCDRLRDELHSAKGTVEQWNTIRNVSMEHVELEIAVYSNRLLEAHVQNVWKLGDEVCVLIIAGFSFAFELAINGNPSGVVDLVEAIETYERAAERFEKKLNGHGNNVGVDWLRFKNIRALALEQMFHNFWGVEKFQGVANLEFVLETATELVSKIVLVKHKVSPCFPSHWHVEALWSSCVANVFTSHIVHNTTGDHCENLPDLTVTQLLELVAWIEYFHETVASTFPEVAAVHNARKAHFEERSELFAGYERIVNMQNLAWDNLCQIHRLAQEEFLIRTRSLTDEWLDKVYG